MDEAVDIRRMARKEGEDEELLVQEDSRVVGEKKV